MTFQILRKFSEYQYLKLRDYIFLVYELTIDLLQSLTQFIFGELHDKTA